MKRAPVLFLMLILLCGCAARAAPQEGDDPQPAPSAPAAGIIRTSITKAIRKLEIRRRRFKGHPSFLTVILP